MSSHKLVVLVVCLLLATLAITVRLAVAMPSAQESVPIKPSESDTGGPVIVDNVTEVLTTTEGLKLSMEPVAAIMTQTFEGTWPAAGWRLLDDSTSDGGEYLWGKRTCHPHAGTNAGWSVGGGAQGSALGCSANYPNYTNTWAIYGPFDLRGATSASLVYHVYGRTESSTTCAFDWFFAGSSTDGTNFSGAKVCGDLTNGPDGNGYTRRTLDLASRLGQSQVWVAFQMRSDFSVVFNGMTIDDVSLNVTRLTSKLLLPMVWNTHAPVSMSLYPHTDFNLHLAPQETWNRIDITWSHPQYEWASTPIDSIPGNLYAFEGSLFCPFPPPYYCTVNMATILRHEGQDTVLASIDRAFYITNGTYHFRQTVSGVGAVPAPGDQLIFRVSRAGSSDFMLFIGRDAARGDSKTHVEIPASR